MRRRILLLAGVALLAGAAPLLAQCAMCQTTLTGSPEGRAMAGGFNRAILVMLAAPYLVFGSLALILFRDRIHGAVVARRHPRPVRRVR